MMEDLCRVAGPDIGKPHRAIREIATTSHAVGEFDWQMEERQAFEINPNTLNVLNDLLTPMNLTKRRAVPGMWGTA